LLLPEKEKEKKELKGGKKSNGGWLGEKGAVMPMPGVALNLYHLLQLFKEKKKPLAKTKKKGKGPDRFLQARSVGDNFST